jgi:hypothetical protein
MHIYNYDDDKDGDDDDDDNDDDNDDVITMMIDTALSPRPFLATMTAAYAYI